MSSNKHWNSYFFLTFFVLPYFTLHFTGKGRVLDLQNFTIYPWLLTNFFSPHPSNNKDLKSGG
jgi:hypothetical protein